MIQQQHREELAAGVIPTEWRNEIAYLRERVANYEKVVEIITNLGLSNEEIRPLLSALARRVLNLKDLLDPKNFDRLLAVLDDGSWRRL